MDLSDKMEAYQQEIAEIDALLADIVFEGGDDMPEDILEEDVDDPGCVVDDSPDASLRGAAARKRRKTPAADRLPCLICKKTYANQRTLKTHVQTHALQGKKNLS